MAAEFTEESVPDQGERTAFVTGANSGIGFEAARVLAGRGARVLIGCRSPGRAAGARDRILSAHPSADVEIVELDLASLASVREAAERVSEEPRLDLLINNAGIMIPPREETSDGFESQFGVNHLGHFALTGLLLDKVRSTAGSRIVSVSSNAHKGGAIDFDDLQAEKSYSRVGRYNMSKLANLLFIFELQRRLEAAGGKTIAVACHPGVSDTELKRYIPSWVMLFSPIMNLMSHDPPEAALPTLRAATDPAAEGGQYFGPSNFFEFYGPPILVDPIAASRDEETARRLWDVSIELTGVDPGLAAG
ncbi:MAG: oxidoreductase [Candidatus Binatia bacterium]|nr:oxidoreductase [Candidatus Binatia bacterium]